MIFGIYYVGIGLLDTGTRCVYKNLFGIPCPGCGMTRSYLHVLEGNWKAAFEDHPLFLFVPVIIIISVVLWIKPLTPRWNHVLSTVLLFIAALFIVVYIVRMITLFPDKDPLKFYDRGLYPSIYRWIRSVFP